MSSIDPKKPHAVLIPFPAQGHVNPFMQLAKLLHSRGFHITFVNTEFNHRRLIRSKGPDFGNGLLDFSFETIPDGLPSSDRDATQDVPSLFESTRKNCIGPFKELLLRLNSCSQVPPVRCIISDGIMSFGIKVAEDLGIPQVSFWPASTYGNFMHDGTLDTQIDWIPGMKNIQLKNLPSFMRTQSLDDILFDFPKVETQNCLKSSAIILNTFNEFEHDVLEALAAKYIPNIFTVGPLPLLSRHVPEKHPLKSLSTSLWKEDPACLEWLDKRDPNSVVYVNYGSVTTMTEESLKEFAWGLAKSKHHFLWIVRPDVVVGSDSATLPEEFFEEIKERGLIAKWCPQQQVLAHSSVAAFLTHCGWNSTLETVCAGVPVICWPFFGDQQTNCHFACTAWGIGVEVNNDVKSDEVAAIVKKMMEGDKGEKLREKVQEWKKKSVQATDIGGSSYSDFDKLIKQALHYDG
ncbi:UDP-glycosyltransferase 85A1 [Morus notabilis]|uniref:Glycosyltransferase n=1 Tax=Morus notabilis TaxID=981085 RepID=W9QJD6_9ROSA|nr:UDP-glycosyltransferase 85A1 [Morus notabilis]